MSDPPIICAPCFFAGTGSLTGLIFGACLQINGCLPVIIGSGIGGGVGCSYCIWHCINDLRNPTISNDIDISVEMTNNIYLVSKCSQSGKDKINA